MYKAYILFFHTMSDKHMKEVTLISCRMIAKMQSMFWLLGQKEKKERMHERTSSHELSKTTQQVYGIDNSPENIKQNEQLNDLYQAARHIDPWPSDQCPRIVVTTQPWGRRVRVFIDCTLQSCRLGVGGVREWVITSCVPYYTAHAKAH